MRSSISFSSRRVRRLLLPAIAITSMLVVSGCGGTQSAGTTSATDSPNQAFSKELHDMLPDSVKKSGVISIGALWETPPIIGTDVAHPETPIGVVPELAAQIAPILGVDVKWLNMPWPAQLPGVQAGNVDVLWGQVTINAEREKSIVDLVAFQKTNQSLLLPAGNPDKVKAVADMCGKTISVPVGSRQATIVKTVSDAKCSTSPIRVAEYPGASAAVQALRAGSVDAWFDVTSTIDAIVKADSNAYTSTIVPDSESPTQFSGVAVGKDRAGLTEAIAGALKKVVEDGSYEEIYKKYALESQILTPAEVVVNPTTGTPPGKTATS